MKVAELVLLVCLTRQATFGSSKNSLFLKDPIV
jgi:hypothetical protein